MHRYKEWRSCIGVYFAGLPDGRFLGYHSDRAGYREGKGSPLQASGLVGWGLEAGFRSGTTLPTGDSLSSAATLRIQASPKGRGEGDET